MKKSRFTDSQILAVLKQAQVGVAVPALCCEHRISTATFYNWRSKSGGMDACLMARMKELKEENRDFATQWLWTYKHERPNVALGGITPKQKLAIAA
jgi:putative transposase